MLNWDEVRIPNGNEGEVWKQFHQNTKQTDLHAMPSEEAVAVKMLQMFECFDDSRDAAVALDSGRDLLSDSLRNALERRKSFASRVRTPLDLRSLSCILRYAYGFKNRMANGRHARFVPSAGALYPLEIYVLASSVVGLDSGSYRYDVVKHALVPMQPGVSADKACSAFVQRKEASAASAIVVVSSVFERVVFKYGDRGYRYCLIEAGHVGQNIAIIASDIGVNCLNACGFYDEILDASFGFDGIYQSSIYAAILGAS
jgi:SagB-type dehydrogenase family enzyme